MNPTRTLFPLLLVLCVTTLVGCANAQTTSVDEWEGLVRHPGR